MNIVILTFKWFLSFIEFALLARVILSWISIRSELIYKINSFLYELTEPLLAPIRKLIEKSIFQGNGNIFDLSPLIAFLLIGAIKSFLYLN